MSFIPSHIQKRMLRFLITKIDIIDADALDLDQLDIAWGMRSSFELRDLKLNVKVVLETPVRNQAD
jgi:autophagy-related protein 2